MHVMCHLEHHDSCARTTLIKYDLGGIILVILTDAILDQARNFMTNKGQFETQSEPFLVTPLILQ